MVAQAFGLNWYEFAGTESLLEIPIKHRYGALCNSQQLTQPPLALRLQSTPRVGGGSAFYVRRHLHHTNMDRISGYWLNRILFGKENADAIWDFQTICLIAAGVVGLAAATIYGICYVGYCLWDQVATEVSCWRKYGANWKVEFERYHGSLAHANTRLAIVFLCLLALLVILGWIGLRVYRMHKRNKHDRAV